MNAEKKKNDIESRLLSYLLQHKLRRTPERLTLIRFIVELRKPFTPSFLLDSIAETGFHLSHGTIYNSLKLFESAGVVRRRGRTKNGVEIYECASHEDEHLTLVCSRCGRAREVKDLEISKFLKLYKFQTFVTSGFDLYIHGQCSRCRSGGRVKKEKP